MLMAPDVGSFPGLRDAAIIAMLVGCGMRVSGLSALNESSLVWTHGQLTVKLREKGANERLVPVPLEAATLVRAYLAHPMLATIDRTTGTGDKVLHSCFRIGDSRIMASDGYCKGKPDFQGFSLTLQAADKDEADRLFKALEPGGQVQMPLTETFFSPRFGMVADRFGVSWMIVTMPEEAARSAA